MSIGLAGIAAVAIGGTVVGSGLKMPAPIIGLPTGCNYTTYISKELEKDDLANKKLITEEDMECLIDYYVERNPESAFKGCAGAFIEASNETGLDPIFLFSLAGIESGWGTSSIHVSQGNPYSMGMYGDGTHNGYELGDSFAEGIIEGANYIYEHYYLNGQTTLYKMNHNGDHSFCAEDPEWERQIELEMRFCYKMLWK